MKPLSLTPPITPKYLPKKLPEYIFYKTTQANSKFTYDVFTLGSTKTKSRLGQIVCHKTNEHLRENYNGPILILDFIYTSNFYKGYGSILLNFAKKYSKQSGCNGYISLKTDSSFTPNRIPHLFYRKHNFSSLNKKIDKKMDQFIRKNKDATYKDFRSIIMHYPPNPKPPSLKEKLSAKIQNLFKRTTCLPSNRRV